MTGKIYLVGMGEYKIATNPVTLVTSGVGSCVAICLYDRTKKIGGMAHSMLPKMPDNYEIDNDKTDGARFVNQSIPLLLRNMKEIGADTSNITAKLVGGANMFTALGDYSKQIGENNVTVAKKMFHEYGIELIAESTGGFVGRSVEFNLVNGIVSIVSKL